MSRWTTWTEETGLVERKPLPSIVVRCRHGIANGAAAFVQRYRYDVSMDRWNPTDYSAEGATYTPNVEGAEPHPHLPPLFDENNDPVNLSHEHFNARCKTCHRLVAMQAHRAQYALTWLSERKLTDVELFVLQRAYNEVPQQHQ